MISWIASRDRLGLGLLASEVCQLDLYGQHGFGQRVHDWVKGARGYIYESIGAVEPPADS